MDSLKLCRLHLQIRIANSKGFSAGCPLSLRAKGSFVLLTNVKTVPLVATPHHSATVVPESFSTSISLDVGPRIFVRPSRLDYVECSFSISLSLYFVCSLFMVYFQLYSHTLCACWRLLANICFCGF